MAGVPCGRSVACSPRPEPQRSPALLLRTSSPPSAGTAACPHRRSTRPCSALRSTPSGPASASRPSSTAGNFTATAPPLSGIELETQPCRSPATEPSGSPIAASTAKPASLPPSYGYCSVWPRRAPPILTRMAGASGGFRRQVLRLAAAIFFGMVAAAGLLHSADAAPPGASSRRMLLRLHDLPPGYIANLASAETGPLDQCDYLHPAEPQPKLAAFVDRYSPKGCFGIYVRLYEVPGSRPAPPVVGTGVLDAGSVEAAEAGLAVAPELISHITEDLVPEEVAPTETIGDSTRLLHWKKVPSLFRPGYSSGSFLVWRSGSVLATMFVDGFR